jgi:hypothetical protein
MYTKIANCKFGKNFTIGEKLNKLREQLVYDPITKHNLCDTALYINPSMTKSLIS